MAGSLAHAYDGQPNALREHLGDRLAGQPDWVSAFEALCAAPPTPRSPLPATLRAACSTPAGAARTSALVTFEHAVWAIGEYERSQVFTGSPWRRYVQGDTSSLSPQEKRGALLFLTPKAEGGFGCADCHSGDLFSDEAFHAVGAPQIGPGKQVGGEDAGRAMVTGATSDMWRFRTPTLLNVEVTAPYFHSGAYGSLRKTVAHYDHQRGRVLEYFGVQNKSDTNTRPWCKMPQFESIPGCAELYSIPQTHAFDLESGLDPLADELRPLVDQRDALLVAFLNTLTDPRVKSPAALSPWVEPSSPLRVTPSSNTWHLICEGQIERTADINLRIMGIRWAMYGDLPSGVEVSEGELYADLFGVRYWELIAPEFEAMSGVAQTSRELSVGVLEVLTAAQRQVLYDAYAEMERRGHYARWRATRALLLAEMGRLRGGEMVSDEALLVHVRAAAALEREDLVTMTSCLLYTSPSPRDRQKSRMPSSA